MPQGDTSRRNSTCLGTIPEYDGRRGVVSWGGGDELGECFLWGEVVEGGAGAVARFVGDGVRVGVGGW